jgi:hypothetical protein
VRRCSGRRDQADVCPGVASGSHRQHALDLIRREVEAARQTGLSVWLLVPLTRSHGGAALQFEVELSSLDQVDQFPSARGRARRRPTGCGPSARSSLHRLRSRSCASMTSKHPEGADQALWRTRFGIRTGVTFSKRAAVAPTVIQGKEWPSTAMNVHRHPGCTFRLHTGLPTGKQVAVCRCWWS